MRIAIYADSFNGKVGQTLPYMNFVGLFGVPRLVTPNDNPQDIVDNCDALFIPGGADVNPARYGEAPHPSTGRANAHYEYMDLTIGQAFIDAGKPVVGICRGMQALNVMFGGSLFQHIRGHQQSTSRDVANQDMAIEGETIKINSIHHQAVKKLGDGLVAIGHTAVYANCYSLANREYLTAVKYLKTKKQGPFLSIVEAFKHETLPVVAFQYHPEEFNCPFAIAEIKKVLDGEDR